MSVFKRAFISGSFSLMWLSSTEFSVFAKYRVPFLCAIFRYAGCVRKNSSSELSASFMSFCELMSCWLRFTTPMKPSLSG